MIPIPRQRNILIIDGYHKGQRYNFDVSLPVICLAEDDGIEFMEGIDGSGIDICDKTVNIHRYYISFVCNRHGEHIDYIAFSNNQISGKEIMAKYKEITNDTNT